MTKKMIDPEKQWDRIAEVFAQRIIDRNSFLTIFYADLRIYVF